MKPAIVQNGDPVLRKKAEPVLLKEARNAGIKKLLHDMQEALLAEDDGVALAAPQIGVSLRVFIVAKGALALTHDLRERGAGKKRLKFKKKAGFLVCINPVLSKLSRGKAVLDEGCLSVRPLYGKVKRSQKATITAYDEMGKRFTRGASGLLAQIFQHEYDHLEGILFIDKAADIKELSLPLH